MMRLLGVRAWRARMETPSLAAKNDAARFKFLERVGSVPRWVRFKKQWHVDPDWLKYREIDRLVFSQLGYQPARQNLNVERQRLEDYDREPKELDDEQQKLLRKALEWAKEHFSVCKGRGIMTVDEAIQYVLDSDCADSSPGYPLNQKYKTKKEALADPEVVAELKSWIAKLGTHDVEGVLFSMSLKDEILKTKKVEANKTRLFMAAPMFHHIAMVMFCAKMHDVLMADRGTFCSAGRDFHYGGWDAMIRSLPWEWFFGADAEAYDMSIHRWFFAAVYELVAEFIPEGGDALLDLFAMALDAFCVSARGDVFAKMTGNPSGWYLTLFLNTVIMYMTLSLAWMRAYPDKDRAEFEYLVRAWLCGDDSLVNVSNDVREKFNEHVFARTWEDFGLIVKEIHASPNVENVEYCGAYTMKIMGKYCRKPRINKFLDSLCFTTDRNPLYKLQRAYSIYYELWPVPEKVLVRGYIQYLVKTYPFLASSARRYEKSEANLCNLHLGLEGQYGAVCKHGSRQKECTDTKTKGKPSTLTIVNPMTKTKSQKDRKKANIAKAIVSSPATAAIAKQASASAIKALDKKKKKGSTWASILSGAAKVAVDLAPALLPALLAKHGPTMARAQMAGKLVGQSSSPVVGAPLNTGVAIQPMCGVTDLRSTKMDGKVHSVIMAGLDYIGDITANSYSLGDVVYETDMNVFSSTFNGTRLQREASLYERYRVRRMAIIYEPTAPATQAGQLIGYIDTDPDEEFVEKGRAAVQAASSHAGAEMGQVWQMICAEYKPDSKTQDFYASPDGSDERLISPGKCRFIAATDLTDGPLGSLYVAYEIEFVVPQIENVNSLMASYADLTGTTSMTPATPLGAGTWDALNAAASNISAKYAQVNGAGSGQSTFYGLPVGSYKMLIWVVGTTVTGMAVSVEGSYIATTDRPGTSFVSNSGTAAVIDVIVPSTSTVPAEGSVYFTCTAATVSQCEVWFFAIPSVSAFRKKKTLQQIEDEFNRRLACLESAFRSATSPPSPIPSGSLSAQNVWAQKF